MVSLNLCDACKALLNNKETTLWAIICSYYARHEEAAQIKKDTSTSFDLESKGYIITHETDQGIFAIPHGLEFQADCFSFCIDRNVHEMFLKQ